MEALRVLGLWCIHVLPHHLLSRIVMRATRVRSRWFKDLLIRRFAAAFRPDLSEAEEQDLSRFEHFNAFFTRSLRDGVRTLPPHEDRAAIACPVDGAVSEAGPIEDGQLLQAKGIRYTVADLLGGDSVRAAAFRGGRFATLYLAPTDYHRIHAPMDARLTGMVYVPGRLFSVNEASARHVPGLFARNERVICELETELGPVALIMVGALFVGGMETVWEGVVTPRRPREIRRWDYDAESPTLARGDELGRFNMGSTVILLFPRDTVTLADSLSAGSVVRMGQEMARWD